MGAEDLEEVAHLVFSHETILRGADVRGGAGIGAGEGIGALGHAEAGEEFALRGKGLDGKADFLSHGGEGAEIDMGGEIGFARRFEHIGIGVVFDALQGVAGLGAGVAIVDGENATALFCHRFCEA